MKQHLSALAAARVVVVGDLMLDRYWSGSTGRISPEAPVPVVRVDDLQERAGGAANVVLNITALGGKALIAGVIGSDEAGDTLERLLQKETGVEQLLVRTAKAPTITKLRVLSRHQQLIRLDFESGAAEHYHLDSISALQQHLTKAHVVVLSDYGKGVLATPQKIIQAARAAGKPVLVDPKRYDFEAYAGASLITPNMSEFEAVVGPCRNEQDIATKASTLMQTHNIEALLVTRSEKGMSLLRRDSAPVHIPAQTRDVFDVTGAGDTVVATMAVAIASGLDWHDAAHLANFAAGIVVGKLGTATASVAELRHTLAGLGENQRGVLDEPALLQAVTDARAQGESVVMTNGCFDILHAGHVAYLEQAARLGDRLIVAVNDDASVERLKGARRPILPLAQRMAVLAGLAAVDWVVPFSEDTPERLICAVRPDCLVKGGDYTPDAIAGHQCAGEVQVLSFVPGHSTSHIIERIRQLGEDA
ncbi:MAG TPA: bifunctional D-glycero-beta-D-manno-heptose-7-phosphate kinase/D-glycero-beta-D-manno-heptose 1-phosphate adenylyltransferase HldE [Gammaproteobacteria bacterium]|nr:bifunctional D-glycero-beta-D-manno-heptose-7-phosphate kinase/D-glycero-beta-D-manno-heptose 1-phosphate adenylyltransferase HldE [Gammaproteobacteria bacterium]